MPNQILDDEAPAGSPNVANQRNVLFRRQVVCRQRRNGHISLREFGCNGVCLNNRHAGRSRRLTIDADYFDCHSTVKEFQQSAAAAPDIKDASDGFGVGSQETLDRRKGSEEGVDSSQIAMKFVEDRTREIGIVH